MLKKVFNWSEVHLFETTCYKIHTLVKLLLINTDLFIHISFCIKGLAIVEHNKNQVVMRNMKKPNLSISRHLFGPRKWYVGLLEISHFFDNNLPKC